MHDAVDQINRKTYQTAEAASVFRSNSGWTDPGEQVVFERVRGQALGKPILDIGVEGGRTTSRLLDFSADYIGIDYTEQMVEICRKKFPGVRIEWGGARDLSRFANGSFGLVMFSFNGIDSMNHADRLKTLSEVYRVLRPGGTFVFSSARTVRGTPCRTTGFDLPSTPFDSRFA